MKNVLCFAAATSVLAFGAFGATAHWTGGGDGAAWSDGANWICESGTWPGAGGENDVAAFTNLSSAISLTLDNEIHLAQISSLGNALVSVAGGGAFVLHGGESDAAAAIRYAPTVSYNNGFDFSVPVSLANEDLAYLYGGVTFRRPVTCASTQVVNVVRGRVGGFSFVGADCTADFSRAKAMILGKPGKDFAGTSLAVLNGARVTVPSLDVAKGASVSMWGASSSLTVLGDVAMPEAMYWNGPHPIYTSFTMQSGAFSCRRFSQGENDGAKATVTGGSFTASDGVFLASTNGASLTVAGGTFRTPRIAVASGASANFSKTVTFDVAALTTCVDRISCAAGTTIRAVGAGAICFADGGEIPALALGDGVTLLFDGVCTNSAPLVLGRLDLPTDGRAKLKVSNRMLEGEVVLVRGITAAQFAAFDVEIPSCATLTLRDDGALTFALPNGDLSRAARAEWIDDGAAGDLDDAANWRCFNLRGAGLVGVLPDSATAVSVSGDTSFALPAGASRDWASFAISGDVRLTADCDWRGVDLAAIAAGTRIDLNGHALLLACGDVTKLATIVVTDSAGGASGELRVEVPRGETFFDRSISVVGNVKIVKGGGGDWVVLVDRPAPSGGEEVLGGRLVHAGAEIRYEDFGAVGDGVADDQSAIVDAHECANKLGRKVKARDGATYLIGGAANVAIIRTDVDFGTAKFIFDDTRVAVADKNSPVFRIASDLSDFNVADVAPLALGAKSLGFRPGRPALVRLVDSTVTHFIREGANANDGAAQQEVVLVNAEGALDPTTPLTWAYTNLSTVTVRPLDARTLVVTGGTFVTIANCASVTNGYFHRGFDVRRSNVEILGMRHEVVDELEDGGAYSGFLSFSYAAHARVRDCRFFGHRYYDVDGVGLGTYDIGASFSIDVSFERCDMAEGHLDDSKRWGVMGSNYCRNLLLDECSFSRFDAHCGVYNATIRNSTMGRSGINAIGFGTLLLENVWVRGGAFVNLRSDYGATWTGDFVVRNCTFEPWGGVRSTGTIISGSWNDAHDFGYDCAMPSRIVFDGFHVVDTNVPNGYAGPWLFANFNKNWTTPDYAEPVPHAQTKRVVMRNFTTASGKPFRLCSNKCLFTKTEIVTNAPPGDVRFSVGEPTVGWNRTNATVRVDVESVDGADGADYALSFVVRDASGAVVSEETRGVASAGEQTFNVDLPSAGEGWTYSVTALRDGYAASLGDAPVAVGAWNGAWRPGMWFGAEAEGGERAETNLTWAAPPIVEAGGYAVEGEATFRVDDSALGSNSHVCVETTCQLDYLSVVSRFDGLDAAAAVAAFDDGGRAHWRALTRDADGNPSWQPLVGDVPATGTCRTVRFEFDFESAVPRARYSVSSPDDAAAFVPLALADGTAWLPLAKDARGIAEVGMAGVGTASAFVGSVGDAALAEVDGERFADLNDALAAAAKRGGTATLLADVIFTPNADSAEATLDAAGRRLKWTDAPGGAAFAWNPETGRFRLLAGGAANGLDSYVSYALGLDASDPDAKPIVRLERVEGTDEWAMRLAVDPPADSGATVSFRLESAASPDFVDSELSAAQASPDFTAAAGGGDARFWRVRIDVQ